MGDPDPKGPLEPSERVTRLLGALGAGERADSAELLPLVYAELRRLAAARLARLAPGQTLQATELVHEAYLRLAGGADVGWEGRAHFFGAAAHAMRDILADHLQRKGSLKRGGHLRRVAEDTIAELGCDGPSAGELAIAEALERLATEYPRQAEVVTLRFFGGLSVEEIAAVQGRSSRTIKRDWRFAKTWLNAWLTEREA